MKHTRFKFHLPASLPEFVVEHTRRLQNDLCRFLGEKIGRKIRIFLIENEDIMGVTRIPPSGKARVILLNPKVLKALGPTETGLKAWNGLGYHEVAHVLNPAFAEYESAGREGFHFLMNVVDDVCNERSIAGQERWLRECFAILNQWLFSQTRKKHKSGARQRDPLSYQSLANDFCYHLNRLLLPIILVKRLPPDLVGGITKLWAKLAGLFSLQAPVRKAFRRIPWRMSSRTKPELLVLARDIHKIFLAGSTKDSYKDAKLTSRCGCDSHNAGRDGNPAGGSSGDGQTTQADPGSAGEDELLLPEGPIRMNLSEEISFNLIDNVQLVEPIIDDELEALLDDITPAAQELRRHLADCGWTQTPREDEESGEELVDDLERFYLGDSNICVDDDLKPEASVDLQVGIDCSTSVGMKLALSKRFGLLVEDGAVDLLGVSAHLWGLTTTPFSTAVCPAKGVCPAYGCAAATTTAPCFGTWPSSPRAPANA